ncbi:TetR/AcrR family transcriptional regulator [Microbacterium sp.]|uniref:TetR/AcrR family transcriptional regulator n=1 Tax=Microbacterium sp. TaxID=51671 RepID=UPI0028B1E52E|nr:TetR/AcrR family transcriptional regulator [Microbacterium sp.]
MERQDRNELILEHASALFAENGIAGTTVRDIAGRAGILSGSLYHYFPSKDAIADHIVMHYLDALIARYRAILADGDEPRTALTRLATASIRVSRMHAHASTIYQRETGYLRQLPSHEAIRAAARTIRETWESVLARGAATQAFRDDLPIPLLYVLIRDAVWLTPRAVIPTAEDGHDIAEAIISVFLDGITVRPDGTDERHSR